MSEWLSQLLDPDLATMTAGAVYAVVWTLVFVESGLLFGFFLPGDTVLFTAGLISADPDAQVSLPLLVAGTTVAAVAGAARATSPEPSGSTSGTAGSPWWCAASSPGFARSRRSSRGWRG